MSLAVEIIFKYMALEPVVIWQKIMKVHSNIFPSNHKGTFYDSEITFSNVEKAIKKKNKPHFLIEFDNAVFRYSSVGNHDHSFLTIKKCIKKINDTHNWVSPFLVCDAFVQARVYNKEYEFWQNASDPLEYESAGRKYDHLPMKSNGLPPPLEQIIIDTSANPGRRILRDGYVEAIGSLMWLGKQFWQLTGTKQETVSNVGWINCKHISSNVLLIKAKDDLFSSSEDGKLQDKLRSLLFP